MQEFLLARGDHVVRVKMILCQCKGLLAYLSPFIEPMDLKNLSIFSSDKNFVEPLNDCKTQEETVSKKSAGRKDIALCHNLDIVHVVHPINILLQPAPYKKVAYLLYGVV